MIRRTARQKKPWAGPVARNERKGRTITAGRASGRPLVQRVGFALHNLLTARRSSFERGSTAKVQGMDDLSMLPLIVLVLLILVTGGGAAAWNKNKRRQ